MEYEELKKSLKEENKRIQSLPGYYDDGSLRIGKLRKIKESVLNDFSKNYGSILSSKYLKFHESVITSAFFNWFIDEKDSDVLAFSDDSIHSFSNVMEYKNVLINEDHIYYKDYGDTHLKKAYGNGYFCLNYSLSSPYILIKFGDDDYSLHLMLEDGEINDLNITLEEYFDFMCKTRGMFMWQAYLCEKCPTSLINNEYDGFFENMEYLFPEVDLNPFKFRELFKDKPSIASICNKYKYLERFHSTFENLPEGTTYHRYNPKYTIAYGVPNIHKIRLVEHHLQVRLPEVLKALYWRMDGFSVNWTGREGYADKRQLANFKISSLQDMFGQIVNDKIKEEHFNNARKMYEVDKERNSHLEDKYVFYTDPVCHILLEFPEDEKVRVWLHYLESDTRNFEIELITEDFTFLMDRLLEYRGMLYWNLYITRGEQDDDAYRRFKSNVEELFEDASYLE